MGNKSKKRQGFTLIELQLVIAVIAILSALIFPAFPSAKQKAERMPYLNNSKQFILALQFCLNNYNGRLSPDPSFRNSNVCVKGEMQDPTNAIDILLLANSLLAPFIAGSITIFKCPSGTTRLIRSFSMNRTLARLNSHEY
ncbi:MAG: prepilin-type N-terminal cleavage/methylation domain [Pedosphaera sp.]|nr:prepilin-type N-terminal cleavage/methylation domain [Pedosphaera sp.]